MSQRLVGPVFAVTVIIFGDYIMTALVVFAPCFYVIFSKIYYLSLNSQKSLFRSFSGCNPLRGHKKLVFFEKAYSHCYKNSSRRRHQLAHACLLFQETRVNYRVALNNSLLGTPNCPRLSDVPILEPFAKFGVTRDLITDLVFREDSINLAFQQGVILTYTRPVSKCIFYCCKSARSYLISISMCRLRVA